MSLLGEVHAAVDDDVLHGPPELVTRAEGLDLVGAEPDARLRNYEIENWAREDGRIVVVSEWCPYNGVFCKLVHYATQADVDLLKPLHPHAAWYLGKHHPGLDVAD